MMHLTDLISQTDISTQACSSQGTNWNNEKNKFKPEERISKEKLKFLDTISQMETFFFSTLSEF